MGTENELSSADVIAEANSRLGQLQAMADPATAEAARDLQYLLIKTDGTRPAAAKTVDDDRKGKVALNAFAFGGIATGSVATSDTLWDWLMDKIGVPDTHLWGMLSLRGAVLFLALIVLMVVFSIALAMFYQRATSRRAIKKLAKAVTTRNPNYKTPVFQCMGDYKKCCSASRQSKVCLALVVICMTKELVPLMSSGSKHK